MGCARWRDRGVACPSARSATDHHWLSSGLFDAYGGDGAASELAAEDRLAAPLDAAPVARGQAGRIPLSTAFASRASEHGRSEQKGKGSAHDVGPIR